MSAFGRCEWCCREHRHGPGLFPVPQGTCWGSGGAWSSEHLTAAFPRSHGLRPCFCSCIAVAPKQVVFWVGTLLLLPKPSPGCEAGSLCSFRLRLLDDRRCRASSQCPLAVCVPALGTRRPACQMSGAGVCDTCVWMAQRWADRRADGRQASLPTFHLSNACLLYTSDAADDC